MQYTDLEQQRKYVVEKLQEQPDPEHLWECILAFQGYGSIDERTVRVLHGVRY